MRSCWTRTCSSRRGSPRAMRGARVAVDVAPEEIFLSVLVVGEVRRGIERLRRRDERQAAVRGLADDAPDGLRRPARADHRRGCGGLGAPRRAGPAAGRRWASGRDGQGARPHAGDPKYVGRGPHRREAAQPLHVALPLPGKAAATGRAPMRQHVAPGTKLQVLRVHTSACLPACGNRGPRPSPGEPHTTSAAERPGPTARYEVCDTFSGFSGLPRAILCLIPEPIDTDSAQKDPGRRVAALTEQELWLVTRAEAVELGTAEGKFRVGRPSAGLRRLRTCRAIRTGGRRPPRQP